MERVEPIGVDLSGVPETLLGNLGRRATAARTGALHDPLAIEVVERLDYDFSDAARGARMHAVRVATFDKAIRRFLVSYPATTVVALGEGLETQFWRVDNGQVRWLTVDVTETMELRQRVLPDGPRQASHRGSALDLAWLDDVDPAAPILVTAQGLLPYFPRDQVHELIGGIARRLPGASLLFDVVPKVMLELVRRGAGRERDLAVELWTWLFDADERLAIARLPGVEVLRDVVPPLRPDPVSLGVAAVARLPRRLRYSLPVFPVLLAKLSVSSPPAPMANKSG
jgi:O-methyltransferase involved in polyketide biosynthesis